MGSMCEAPLVGLEIGVEVRAVFASLGRVGSKL